MCAEDRRAQLLIVATRLFAAKGYDETTTAAIAGEAGVSEPVLYRHFSSKLELFREILAQTAAAFVDHCCRLSLGRSTGAARLLAIVDGFPEFCRERVDLLRMIDRALVGVRDDCIQEVLREHYEAYCAVIAGHIVAGRDDGSIAADVDARMSAWMLIMTGIGFSMLTALIRDDLGDRRIADELSRRVGAMLRP